MKLRPDYRIMNRLRFQPRMMQTLERKIDRDRDELIRVRNDMLYETQQINALRRHERTCLRRIERNTEELNRLRVDDMKLRQKMAEAGF